MKFIIDTDPGTDDAVAILIALAHFTDKEFGARPLRRSIQRLLEDPLSEELLQGKYKAGSTIIISLNKDENTLEFESVEAPDEPPVDFVDSES